LDGNERLVCGDEVLELSAGVFEKMVVFYRLAGFQPLELQRRFREALFALGTILSPV
jgi:hypothetical protein